MLEHLNFIFSKVPFSYSCKRIQEQIIDEYCPEKTILYDNSDHDIKLYVSPANHIEVEKLLSDNSYFFRGKPEFYQCKPDGSIPITPYCIIVEDMFVALNYSLNEIGLKMK